MSDATKDETAPRRNEFGQPIGEALPDWTDASLPGPQPLVGAHVTVRPLDPDADAGALFDAFAGGDDSTWTYMASGPFRKPEELRDWLRQASEREGFAFYTWVVDGRPLGYAAFMRIRPSHGSIEIGHVTLGDALRRTREATEGFFLMMRAAFDELGYRRLEWKCDALNAPSRAAAERLGFVFEGVFRNDLVTKGRSRDTAWYTIIDREWPPIRTALQSWLDPANFDPDGGQRGSLAAFRQSPSIRSDG